MPVPAAAAASSSSRSRNGDGRADHCQQPHRRRGQRKVRDRTCGCCWSPASPMRGERAWRNHPQVRPGRRSRAFHYSAPAREAGRHADPRALADCLSDSRALRGQARGVRPDHLRPLSPARRAALHLLRQHRPLCARSGRRHCWRRSARPSPRLSRSTARRLGRVLPAEPSGNIFEQGYRPGLTETGQPNIRSRRALPGSAAGPNGEPTWGRWFRQVDVHAGSRQRSS